MADLNAWGRLSSRPPTLEEELALLSGPNQSMQVASMNQEPVGTPVSAPSSFPALPKRVVSLPSVPYQPKGSGGEQSAATDTTYKHQRNMQKLLMMDPYQQKIAMLMAQGIAPGYATNEDGGVQYDKVPEYGPDGKIIGYKAGDPILDESKNVTDESHPFQMQKRGIDDSEKRLAGQAAIKPELDLSALMAFSDWLAGTKLAQSYKRPESLQEQMKRVNEYSSKIQDDKRDLYKSATESVRSMKGGSLTDQLLAQLLTKDETKNDDPNKFIRSSGGAGKPYDPNKDVQKLSDKLSPFSDLWSVYTDLDKKIGGVDSWNGKDIPGIGVGKLMPSFMLSKQGSDIKQTYSDLKNRIQYAYSGKTINEQEYRRLSEALGSSLLSGDREFIAALKRFKSTLKDVARQRESGFGTHPEVIQIYRKGNGFGSWSIGDSPVKTEKAPSFMDFLKQQGGKK